MNTNETNYTYIINLLLLIQKNSLGDSLRKLRKFNRLSQEELALELNISQQHISSLENNSGGLSLNTFIKLCEVFSLLPNR